MAAITQHADGSYAKTYSDMELMLVKTITEEVKARQSGDQQLWIDVTGLSNRVTTLEGDKVDLSFIQNEIINAMGMITKNRDDITRLDALLGVDTYSKEEIMQLISFWRVEQISHVFTQPTSAIFDKINIDDLRSGYKGYLLANINEPHDNHIPENTMQRYIINAFVETPRQVTFKIFFADRCTFVLNGVEEGVWADTGGNFGGVAKLLVLDFKEGWNEIQIMIANETQRGGLVVESDLFEKADYLSNLDDFTGMITGDRIAHGTLDERHLSPNMNLTVNTLHATAVDRPAVIVGDPESCGILQIGDKTISKCIDEPFVFDDGIRVNGYIYVSQLLIDKDFIIQGDGILIEKQIDPITGFTEAYIIHNDMTITNGGGLTIVGDARKGYTITNAMKLIVDGDLNGWLPPNPEISPGGLDISGDAVKGYYIRNNMLLVVEGTGGLLVTGNAFDGYYIKNIMNLSSPKGLEVVGNPWEAAGYKIRNKMTMTGKGVILTPSIEDGSYYNWDIENDTKIEVGNGLDIDKLAAGHFKIWNIMELEGERIIVQPTGDKSNGYSKWKIINDMLLESFCGGIEVRKEGNGHWSIKNTMGLTFSSKGPIKRIDGDACTGYRIVSEWPELEADIGIDIDDNGDGKYIIKNTGVIELDEGNGIEVEEGRNGVWTITNTGVVSLDAGIGIEVDEKTNGEWEITNIGVIKLRDGNGIDTREGSNGEWEITNTGVVKLEAGDGISVHASSDGEWEIENEGVLSVGVGGIAKFQGSAQNPVIYVPEPTPPPQVSISSPDGSVNVGGMYPYFTLTVDIPEPQAPIIINPPVDNGGGGETPPPDPGGGGDPPPAGNSHGGDLGYISHGDGLKPFGGYQYKTTQQQTGAGGGDMGIASGTLTWGQKNSYRIAIRYGAYAPTGVAGRIKIGQFEYQNGPQIGNYQYINVPSSAYLGDGRDNLASGYLTVNRAENAEESYVGVWIEEPFLRQKPFAFWMDNKETASWS